MGGGNGEGLEREGLGLVRIIGFNGEKICEDFLMGFEEGRGKGLRGGEENVIIPRSFPPIGGG